MSTTATFKELVEDPRYGFALKLRESDGKMVYMDDDGRYFYEDKFTNTPLHFTDIQRLEPITYSLPDPAQLVDVDKERFGYIKPTVEDIKIPLVEYDAGELGEIVAVAKAPENYQQILDELQKKKEAYEEQLYLDWLNSPKGEFKLNLDIQTTWGNRGFDYLNGAAYSQGYLDHLYDPELLRRWNNFSLGLMAPSGLFAAPALAPGTVGGTIIGNVAGSLAIGNTLEGTQRWLFGESLGDKTVLYLINHGVSPFIAEMARPEYWLNPTGKYTSSLISNATNGYKALAKRFTPDGFVIGDYAYKLHIDPNRLYAGVTVPEVVRTSVKGLHPSVYLDASQVGKNTVVLDPNINFLELSKGDLIDAIEAYINRLPPGTKVSVAGMSTTAAELYAASHGLYAPMQGNQIIVPYYHRNTPVQILHKHSGQEDNLDALLKLSVSKDKAGRHYDVIDIDNPVDVLTREVDYASDNVVPLVRDERTVADNIIINNDLPTIKSNKMLTKTVTDKNNNTIILTAFPEHPTAGNSINFSDGSWALLPDKLTVYYVDRAVGNRKMRLTQEDLFGLNEMMQDFRKYLRIGVNTTELMSKNAGDLAVHDLFKSIISKYPRPQKMTLQNGLFVKTDKEIYKKQVLEYLDAIQRDIDEITKQSIMDIDIYDPNPALTRRQMDILRKNGYEVHYYDDPKIIPLHMNGSRLILKNQPKSIQRFLTGGKSGNRFDNFVNLLYPSYEKAFEKYGLNKAYIPYLLKLDANESTYGLNPRGGADGHNYGGVKWNSSHGRTYVIHTDGKKYTRYKNPDDFADHHTWFINNIYDKVLETPNLDLYRFMYVLHGNNSGKRSYSEGTAQSYYNVANNMKSLDRAIAKYLKVGNNVAKRK